MNEQLEGTVKSFDTKRKFGFIFVPGKLDYYFHITDMQNPPAQTGDLVTFTQIEGTRGRAAAGNVVVTKRAAAPETQPRPGEKYYGKAVYGRRQARTDDASVPGAVVLGGAGARIAGPAGAIVGGLLGAVLGRSATKEGPLVEITSPCLRCGGVGQVTARADGFIGFQCKKCLSFWRKRDIY